MKHFWICMMATLTVCLKAEVIVPRLSPLPQKVAEECVPLAGTWTFNEKSKIEVPGEWVMQGFEIEPGQEAIYERAFQVPSRWKGKRVKLRCNGIYSQARIQVNGIEVGSH